MKRIDLTGQKIGFWQVGEPVRKNGKIYYRCTCANCRKEREVSDSALRRGSSLSCGCVRAILNKRDLSGQKFGMLTVKRKVIIDGQTYWECTCACGNTKNVKGNALRSGMVKTCGCRTGTREKIRNSLEPYCYNGTYIPALENGNLKKNNTSGVCGVGYRKDRSKYRAYIKFQGKNIHLGLYDTMEEAIQARQKAEEKYFGKIIEKYEEEKRSSLPDSSETSPAES